MEQRFNTPELVPELYRRISQLDGAVQRSGLSTRLLHLVKLRASQINGCAYCVHLHTREALADGFDPLELHLVAVWRESPVFNNSDRAALEWTESLTQISYSGVPDTTYRFVRSVFSEKEIAQLTIAVGTINIWNRIAVSSRLMHPIPSEITRD